MKINDYLLAGVCVFFIVFFYYIYIPASFILGFAAIIYLLFYLYRSLSTRLKNIEIRSMDYYNQIQSLFSIYHLLEFKLPLPKFGNWAISPDFANLLINLIFKRKPAVVLETGSGLSSILIGYCIKKAGSGKLISLEHNNEYVELNTQNIIEHGLQDIVKIIYAPLKKYTINNMEYIWYDFIPEEKIDLLLVDGPPADIQKDSRYPALPLLIDKLSDDSLIILDDTIREDEKRIISRWLNEFPGFQSEFVDLEKGAAILTKQKSTI